MIIYTLNDMNKLLLLFAWAFSLTTSAQTAVIDSIDVSDIYNIEVADTIDGSNLTFVRRI